MDFEETEILLLLQTLMEQNSFQYPMVPSQFLKDILIAWVFLFRPNFETNERVL